MNKLEQAARQALEVIGDCSPNKALVNAAYALRDALAGTDNWTPPNYTDEQWQKLDQEYQNHVAEQEPFDMDDHPPHRLCECRKCMEYFTPLPDCDAFATFGKPIAEQEPVAWRWPTHNGYAYAETHFDGECGEPLYAAPVRTKDLTDEDKLALWKKWNMTADQIDAVIAAYKEKNK